ncbi:MULTISPECIES: WD40/YVTN/BNR-like repeat-containing protein [unclassified Nocardioides]|uniref:WD40/YVTN/BNR-like repeat-containing protein n=1 Tax=unclassified Nocardioides TaxID=2615069 RepID=UPI00362082B7
MRKTLGILAIAALAAPLAATAAPTSAAPDRAPRLSWHHVDVDTDQQLRGLDAVDADTAWVGGSGGGVWRTRDGGETWDDVSPKGAKGLLFRDIEAEDHRTALAMSIGEGRDSRIYRTTNGGRTWQKAFVNKDESAFYDCMAMYDDGRRGLAMSDPVDGKFRILRTRDAGETWKVVDPAGMPAAVEGEFGFAASGTCLVTSGKRAYLASGGGAARIFVSSDFGKTWTVRESTIAPSAAGGVFSMAYDGKRGVAVGGDFEQEDVGTDAAAYSRNRGNTWKNAGDLGGYRSGVTWWRRDTAIAVGPSGSDVSRDGGKTWKTFSTLDLDAVQCVGGACWASGKDGGVVTLQH